MLDQGDARSSKGSGAANMDGGHSWRYACKGGLRSDEANGELEWSLTNLIILAHASASRAVRGLSVIQRTQLSAGSCERRVLAGGNVDMSMARSRGQRRGCPVKVIIMMIIMMIIIMIMIMQSLDLHGRGPVTNWAVTGL